MLDYFDVGKMVKVENSLSSGKKVSRLLKVTDSSIDVAVTQSSQVSMTLLTSAKADSVIAVVQTYQVPYFDSQISFYDVDWNKL